METESIKIPGLLYTLIDIDVYLFNYLFICKCCMGLKSWRFSTVTEEANNDKNALSFSVREAFNIFFTLDFILRTQIEYFNLY